MTNISVFLNGENQMGNTIQKKKYQKQQKGINVDL